jgi:CheY-like chemotaxis protein
MKRVIIAEDVLKVLNREQSFLNRADIRIFSAASNEEAVALHRAVGADLIIAKLDSVGMNGETFTSLIRDNEALRQVSLIIVSSDTESDRERCLQCRANVFVTAPVTPAVLLQEAYQLLNISQRRSCRVPVRIKIQGTAKKRPFDGSVENISVSGMLFRSGARLYEGDTIVCSFTIPDSASVTTDAEIIRVIEGETEHDAHHYAVLFVDLRPDFISAIEVFVEKECQPA